MKTPRKAIAQQGFTLVEMIGVLAVIAVLAALLIPKIFAAINESRLNNTVASYNTVKSAAMTYFGKYGKFEGLNGATLSAADSTNWDGAILLKEGLIEKPFVVRMGNSARVQVRAGEASVAVDDDNAAYNLSGLAAGGTNEIAGAIKIVEAVIVNAPLDDAVELDARIDGPTLSTNSATAALKGRVKWGATAETGGTGYDVFMYIAHK